MYPISQEHGHQIKMRVNPKRSTGKTGMTVSFGGKEIPSG
jgi:hypothetical protein